MNTTNYIGLYNYKVKYLFETNANISLLSFMDLIYLFKSSYI